MCKAIMDEFIRQIAAHPTFRSNPRGQQSKEGFNLTKFSEAAFHTRGLRKWQKLVDHPERLQMIEALNMAKALGKPLDRILILAEEHAKLNPDPLAGAPKEQELNFLNDEEASG